MPEDLQLEMRSYIDWLTSVKPDRFIGSKGHRSSFRKIKGLLSSWGLETRVQPFLVEITVPERWSLELDLGKGFERIDSLPDNVEVTHESLFDKSNEGIRVKDKPVFSVQYHPEASPGPQDSHYLFGRFIDMIRDNKDSKAGKKAAAG